MSGTPSVVNRRNMLLRAVRAAGPGGLAIFTSKLEESFAALEALGLVEIERFDPPRELAFASPVRALVRVANGLTLR